jgi:nucleoside 2-deoxyribosyltransferase
MKLFISYSHGDERFASSLREGLERLGAFVIDPAASIRPGESLDYMLREAIGESDAAVLIVPETESRGANWAFFEAGAAKALGKPVAVVLPSAGNRELPTVADFAILDAAQKSSDEVAKTLVHILAAA